MSRRIHRCHCTTTTISPWGYRLGNIALHNVVRWDERKAHSPRRTVTCVGVIRDCRPFVHLKWWKPIRGLCLKTNKQINKQTKILTLRQIRPTLALLQLLNSTMNLSTYLGFQPNTYTLTLTEIWLQKYVDTYYFKTLTWWKSIAHCRTTLFLYVRNLLNFY